MNIPSCAENHVHVPECDIMFPNDFGFDDQESIDELSKLLINTDCFKHYIELANGHKFDVSISGKWYSVMPHKRQFSEEEIKNPNITENELDLVKKIAYEEFEKRKNSGI